MLEFIWQHLSRVAIAFDYAQQIEYLRLIWKLLDNTTPSIDRAQSRIAASRERKARECRCRQPHGNTPQWVRRCLSSSFHCGSICATLQSLRSRALRKLDRSFLSTVQQFSGIKAHSKLFANPYTSHSAPIAVQLRLPVVPPCHLAFPVLMSSRCPR
ncbi:hypothetical protein BU26DRAFT_129566 [Trematosphaeria pertusa]|uniref:Uncharacterized protein n=1 Tax=Trematosphaeria pertusa TaxID=390896 RepID=A0A6A6HWM7_9PLEO|nr:uncharacterized protein BU26DRAFT_129566 [Trematosphaeria pertusa]KAF2242614.1 hypothetical protein BU26DRAFT_129566 [Trematosphaeria pertusa]